MLSSVVRGAKGSGRWRYELIKSDNNAVLAESRMVIIGTKRGGGDSRVVVLGTAQAYYWPHLC